MSPTADLTKPLSIRPYRRAWPLVATTMLILAMGVATFSVLFVSYQDTMRNSKLGLVNLATAFAAQTASLMQAVEHGMLETEHDFPELASGSTGKQPVAAFSANHLAQHNLLAIDLFDTAGRLIANEVADEPAATARAHRSAIDMTPGAMRVSIEQVDPATGHGVLSFSRYTVDAAGKRTGTIVARARSEQFEQAFNRVRLGKGGSVAMINRDGILLVRAPSFPSAIGRSLANSLPVEKYLLQSAAGAFVAKSPIDGIERVYGYQALSNYPLVVAAANNLDHALAPWFQRVWTALVFFLLIAMTLIFLAWRIMRDAAHKVMLIGELAASEARAENSAAYLDTILNSIGTPIWVLDETRRIVMHNDAFNRFVGRAPSAVTERQERDALDPASAGERELRYQQVLQGNRTAEAITEMCDGNGAARTVIQLSSKLFDAAGRPQVVSVLTDITEREKAEQRLAYLANFDLLTGLPNQVQFRRLLEAELAGTRAGHACVGVLVVSLERLQEISSLLGHEAGEGALEQIGEVFRSLLPQAKCVARMKSNEFALLLEADAGRAAVEQFAIDLLRRLSGPLRVVGREFYLGPVIGVSLYPEDGTRAEDLLRQADSARNRADASRDDTIHFFSERAQTDLDDRLRVEAQLHYAIERGEFRQLYQPKVDIATGRIVGFEALLRWTNPELGEVSPVRFIPIAERTGLIIEIGAWTLREACRQIRRWHQAGTQVKVAVNLSPRQFHSHDLLPMIRRCLDESAIDPASLELEITETSLMSREQEVDTLMHQIRALGITLSIDDFGTGYSSLAYLKRFPVQRLKVDRAFVRDLGKDDDSAAIVRSIVNLAHGLKLAVVAEGVETEEQVAILRSMSCDQLQGFLLSHPVEAGAVLALCEQNRVGAV